jgi:6-pyruvoyltetrahydropterin/6-carboxytetrahydropterin synthase
MITASRYHDISCGHRVVGHEGKCRFLHGHNYRVHFRCVAEELDDVGRVIDFGTIKSTLCQWLEENWDHRFLAWGHDTLMLSLRAADLSKDHEDALHDSIVWVPFNPTAENMADHLLRVVGPSILPVYVILVSVVIEETRKCSVEATL